MSATLQAPPLALYIHIPWCVQKCPYCDFNSHGQKSALPEKQYIAHLLDDLAIDAELVGQRPVSSIFFGGGTPSLFSAEGIEGILQGVKQRVNLAQNAEITLEANPGTVEAEKFSGFYQAGINRLSIGVQSFQQAQLQALGRIHDAQQARNAAGYARRAGINNFNLDLMHGLPDQTLENALQDLQEGIDQHPSHLSWYQLTIEPNTLFASKPPQLPDDDVLWEIQAEGHQRLSAAGYQQYEISGYSQSGQQCRHNLNYWRFGDYLGVGCGAHGKITLPELGIIRRTVKVKHPKGYMDLSRDYISEQGDVAEADRPFEFMMNRLRLVEACPVDDYHRYTGLAASQYGLMDKLQQAADKGLIHINADNWQTTPLGRRYLNTLLETLV